MSTFLNQVNWEEINPKLDALIEKYRGDQSALIEVLHRAQEIVGFLPEEVQAKIAEGLNVSMGDVYSVISFYAHFSTKPKGKYHISLCMGTACYVKGAPEIVERLEKELNIKAGDTTDDGMYSLEIVRCLGACGLGPVMTVNGEVYGLLSPDKAVSILKEIKSSEVKK
ncbi:NADH dehydrogenase [Anoxybacter fermentans]|uniref:NADH dehydrogenase n=1 Tax=Anoxybacter fermentans TaxID=1323375 RepID=A0A3Q9HPJ4_9FIRM|nr:NAD(P)H-dependent oxidoreductase subunit E [Anoxybacter fermentans]AZR72721.1 NADH dehydrogenase [Anoxybacter fermentans]